MELLLPGTGLILWQLITFLMLVIVLGKFAWKPILHSLKEREDSIEQALQSAEKAKIEMAALKAGNEKLLREARDERDAILRDARNVANRIHDQAQTDARKNTDKMIEDAKAVILAEKQNTLREVKAEVASLSLEIAGQILKKNLNSDASQRELVETYLKDVNLN